jgi:hypothetical protein
MPKATQLELCEIPSWREDDTLMVDQGIHTWIDTGKEKVYLGGDRRRLSALFCIVWEGKKKRGVLFRRG